MSEVTLGDDASSNAYGPVEREVRRSVVELGKLDGIRPALAEICYALARALDSDAQVPTASTARELAVRLAELAAEGSPTTSVADELAARRDAHLRNA